MAKTSQSGFDLLAGATDEEEEQEEKSEEQEATKDEVDEKMDGFETFFQETTEEGEKTTEEGEKPKKPKKEVIRCHKNPLAVVAWVGGRSGKVCVDGGSSIIKCNDKTISHRSRFTLYLCNVPSGVAMKGERFGKYCIDTKEGIKCNQDSITKMGIFKIQTVPPAARRNNVFRMAIKGKRSGQLLCRRRGRGNLRPRLGQRMGDLQNEPDKMVQMKKNSLAHACSVGSLL